eukprot:GHVT01059416.1.p1 GENE.GHVT01059416.1~~GHVT01059416.1.p1  ORF type:complete len:134 (+),score=17.88 GHVT01059416.1:1284-1685(+)
MDEEDEQLDALKEAASPATAKGKRSAKRTSLGQTPTVEALRSPNKSGPGSKAGEAAADGVANATLPRRKNRDSSTRNASPLKKGEVQSSSASNRDVELVDEIQPKTKSGVNKGDNVKKSGLVKKKDRPHQTDN